MTATIKKEDKGVQGTTASQTKSHGDVSKGTLKTVEEQIKFFDGLALLVKKKRVLERHKEALGKLELPDEVHESFGASGTNDITISIEDSTGKEYQITNTKLVQELRAFLVEKVGSEIAVCDSKILSYGA